MQYKAIHSHNVSVHLYSTIQEPLKEYASVINADHYGNISYLTGTFNILMTGKSMQFVVKVLKALHKFLVPGRF